MLFSYTSKMRKQTNAILSLVIALSIVIFANGYNGNANSGANAGIISTQSHIQLGNFNPSGHIQSQVAYTQNVNVAAYNSMDAERFQILSNFAPVHADFPSMMGAISNVNIPRTTLPEGPIRYFTVNVNIPRRDMDAYWDP